MVQPPADAVGQDRLIDVYRYVLGEWTSVTAVVQGMGHHRREQHSVCSESGRLQQRRVRARRLPAPVPQLEAAPERLNGRAPCGNSVERPPERGYRERMTTESRTFPPRPLRAVKAVYARQAGCPSSFALAVTDFELGVEGVEFKAADTSTVPGWSAAEVAELHEAFGAGVREELAALEPGTTVAVAVVVRSIKVHEVDTHPRAFRQAGRQAVRNALMEAYGPPPTPWPRLS